MILNVPVKGMPSRTVAPISELTQEQKTSNITSTFSVRAFILGANLTFKEPSIKQGHESEGIFYGLAFDVPKNLSEDEQEMFDELAKADMLIPVLESKVFSYDLRGLLAQKFPQHNWIHADFKDAFYELDQATKGFQDLDFVHLKSILIQNEKNSKESFQAFGITFPIETTTKWGTLIIIAIQFYFFLHSMEYRKKRFVAQSDVAWIGIYNSFGAKVLFGTTALLLPLAVTLFVCIKAGLLQQMPIRNFLLCSVAVALSLLFAALTAKEYFKKDLTKA